MKLRSMPSLSQKGIGHLHRQVADVYCLSITVDIFEFVM